MCGAGGERPRAHRGRRGWERPPARAEGRGRRGCRGCRGRRGALLGAARRPGRRGPHGLPGRRAQGAGKRAAGWEDAGSRCSPSGGAARTRWRSGGRRPTCREPAAGQLGLWARLRCPPFVRPPRPRPRSALLPAVPPAGALRPPGGTPGTPAQPPLPMATWRAAAGTSCPPRPAPTATLGALQLWCTFAPGAPIVCPWGPDSLLCGACCCDFCFRGQRRGAWGEGKAEGRVKILATRTCGLRVPGRSPTAPASRTGLSPIPGADSAAEGLGSGGSSNLQGKRFSKPKHMFASGSRRLPPSRSGRGSGARRTCFLRSLGWTVWPFSSAAGARAIPWSVMSSPDGLCPSGAPDLWRMGCGLARPAEDQHIRTRIVLS